MGEKKILSTDVHSDGRINRGDVGSPAAIRARQQARQYIANFPTTARFP